MAYGLNINLRKTNKKNHIIDLFREQDVLSKIMAKNLSGYSMETIISIFSTLIAEDLIVPSDGEQKLKGRKAQFFRLNDARKVYLGVTFNQQGIHSSMVSFSGRILDSYSEPLERDITREAFISRLKNHVRYMLERNESLRESLARVGLSVPGDVDPATGVLRSYIHIPSLAGTDFRGIIEAAAPGTGVTVEHNINSMASSLLDDRGRQGAGGRILFVSARSGTACALIQDGVLVTGNGELGHVKVSDNGEPCPCGRRGCLDLFFSYRSFMDILAAEKGESAARLSADVALASLGRSFVEDRGPCRNELKKRLGYFTSALMDAVNITSPEHVVLTGELLGVYGDPVREIDALARSETGPGEYINNYLKARIEYRPMGAETAATGICRDIIGREWSYSSEEIQLERGDGDEGAD